MLPFLSQLDPSQVIFLVVIRHGQFGAIHYLLDPNNESVIVANNIDLFLGSEPIGKVSTKTFSADAVGRESHRFRDFRKKRVDDNAYLCRYPHHAFAIVSPIALCRLDYILFLSNNMIN